ncbi:MAG: hypothetical protein DRN96_03605 [Thermoproteota archaeon]|nr:MAG: hypothetical protein DRN96_03605 [Candidatus Korarchaeota archaeon]RLG55248.1 MAG: hypothetical protein DRN99_03220 [Candidatus Korarchaeota archaeon]
MRLRCAAVAFVSELHGSREESLEALRWASEELRKLGVEVYEAGVVVGREGFRDALEHARDAGMLLLLAGSGGAGGVIVDFWLSCGKPVLVAGLVAENGYASAVKAHSRIRRLGGWSRPACIESPGESRRLEVEAKAVAASAWIRQSRIGVVGYERPSIAEARALKAVHGATVVYVKSSLVKEWAEKASASLEALGAAEIAVDASELEKAAKLAAALKAVAERLNLTAITLDCFRLMDKLETTPCIAAALLNSSSFIFSCEGDLKSTLSMMLLSRLSGKPAWMANIARASGERLLLAHCTAPLAMLDTVKITTHFETGRYAAVTGRFKASSVTIAKFTESYGTLLAGYARVANPQPRVSGVCRAQLELEADIEKIIDALPENHLALVEGDLRSEVKSYCSCTGVKLVEAQ